MVNKETAQFWAARINSVTTNRHYEKWLKKAKGIVKRFGGDSFDINNLAKQLADNTLSDINGYNLLFRNIKIRLPYLLPYIPSVVVERENKDADDAGKYAAMILERIANSAIKKLDLNALLKSEKLYAELYGLATPWLRYEQTTAVREIVDEFTGAVAEEEYVASEEIKVDLVNPMDLIFDPQKTWDKVKWCGRKIALTRADFRKKFPDADENGYSFAPVKEEKTEKLVAQDTDVCDVYEIWDKKSRKVYFYCATSGANDGLLRVENYPCDMDFPCPAPLMYDEYPDTIFTPSRHAQYITQYKQVDAITESINKIIPTLWVNGFYPKELTGLDKAFNKANENCMVGINIPKQLLAQMPGAKLQDFIVYFDRVAQTTMLSTLYNTRENLIGDIQRGLGIIGLMEGQTNVQEGVQTNKIKGTFGTLWIQEDQKCVAQFLVRFFTLYLSMASQMFEPTTLIEESTIYEIDDYKKFQDEAQRASAQGQVIANPFEQAVNLIKDNDRRNIHLDIATEDTRSYVDAEYRAQLVDLQTTVMNNLQSFGNIVNERPEFAPLFKAMFMQTIRAHRIGKQFEDDCEKGIDFAIDAIQRKSATPPQQPQPDPTVVAAAKIDADARVQTAQINAQTKENIESAKLQAGVAKDGNKVITDAQLKVRELDLEQRAQDLKAENDAANIDIKQQNTDIRRDALEVETALSIAKGIDTGNFDADL